MAEGKYYDYKLLTFRKYDETMLKLALHEAYIYYHYKYHLIGIPVVFESGEINIDDIVGFLEVSMHRGECENFVYVYHDLLYLNEKDDLNLYWNDLCQRIMVPIGEYEVDESGRIRVTKIRGISMESLNKEGEE